MNEIIKQYTKNKVPKFFTYAKNKEDANCELTNSSTMNRISNAIEDKSLSFRVIKNLNKIDYKMFTNGDKIVKDIRINDLYNELNQTYGSNLKIIGSKKMNEVPILKYIQEKIDELGYSEDEIVNSLSYFLYNKQTTRKKKLFWLIYGEKLIENLTKNIDHDTEVCMTCGQRVELGKLVSHKCLQCRKAGVDTKNGIKQVICIDCECSFEVASKNNKTKRCPDCQSLKTKEKYRKYNESRV